jgi:predicted DsbA family dithiol-disulfide isomerase
MTARALDVEVVSDVVCPWCFIGKRHLEKALEAFPARADVRVRWRPFELNPGLPKEGADRMTYHAAKFGGPAGLAAVYARVTAFAGKAGLELALDRIRRQPNTFDAHRLMAWAEPQGRQGELAEALFRAFFQEARDVGDSSVLAEIAGAAGLDAGRARRLLGSGEGVAELRDEEQRVRGLGIRAVPTFVVDGRLMLTGAEPPEVLLQALEEAFGSKAP